MATILNSAGNSISIDELKKVVQKENDSRLIFELKCGQRSFSETETAAMNREDLIKYVTILRQLNGSTQAVRQHIIDFDTSYSVNFDNLAASNVVTGHDTDTTNITDNSAISQPPNDLASMFALMMSHMQQQERNRREELDLRKEEMRLQRQNDKSREERLAKEANARVQRENELEGRIDRRLHRAHQVMSGILYNMPTVPGDLVSYFEQVDKLFDTNHIDEDLRMSLLTPFLSDKARNSILNLPTSDVDTYTKFKTAILREHRLTPQAYRRNFNEAQRQPDESCTQFVSRLTCYFKHYVESRNITTFKDLFDLVVVDKLKDALKHYTRCYVADRETDNWLRPHRVAELVDLYEVERTTDSKSYDRSQPRPKFNYDNYDSITRPKQTNDKTEFDNQGHRYWRAQITCFVCNKKGHMARDCYFKDKPQSNVKQTSEPNKFNHKVSTESTRGNNFKQGGANNYVPKKTITCFLCGKPNHKVGDCPQNSRKLGNASARKVTVHDIQSSVTENHNETDIKQFNVSRVELGSDYIDLQPDTLSTTITKPINNHTILSKYVIPKNSCNETLIDFGAGRVKFIQDTGAQISVVRSDMIPAGLLDSDFVPTVALQGAFGQTIQAKLVEIQAKISSGSSDDIDAGMPVSICCAVTDELVGDEALISSSDFDCLSSAPSFISLDVKPTAKPDWLFANSNTAALSVLQNNLQSKMIDPQRVVSPVKQQVPPRVVPSSSDILRAEVADKFRNAQKKDSTLNFCWDAVKREDKLYECRSNNQLLYHFKVVSGVKVAQLILPIDYRVPVLEAAHDSQWSMHFGVRKTIQRIETHFYWPTLIRDVKSYVRSCGPCQKRQRRTKFDRVPISPVVRADSAFDVVNVDLIGPLEPPSSRGHKYILCLVDSCTRWVEAVPLKSLTAKEACDALISIFTRTGIPGTIINDNGTNLVSGLNKELHKRLGIEMRCSTPGHPEGNSLVERWNQTLKRMLNLVVNSDSPRDWDKQLPFLLWAYKELPNDTTGISPYQLLYGKMGRGPLAILKDTFANDLNDSIPLNHSVQQYMDKLRSNLDAAFALAQQNASVSQNSYTNYYNNWSKDKCFSVGEEVLVLHPNSTNKLQAQWLGPVSILAQVSPYSYQVKMPNSGIKVFHANHLRRYTSRIGCLGVVFDDDTDFGQIETCPTDKEVFDDSISKLDISHLQENQQMQLRNLLTKYREVFSDKPGQCKVACHEINLKEGFTPQKQRSYRIPDKFKTEVERQINTLLEDGKIRPSMSEYGHPIVCVAKPNNEMRLCTDMRYINSGTIGSAYPTPCPEELLLQVSQANFITTLDCASGYWQIPMRTEDIHKTAFKTHKGLFEWLVMPFGLKTASNTFQKVMNDLLYPHSDYANAYIDDTAVHSFSWEDHLMHLERVFQAFLDVGMTLKLSKSHFAKPKVNYIGHVVGSGLRTVQQDKVEAIKNIPEPTNKKQLRSFLGVCSFYRSYVPRFSEIALPLTNLTKNDQPNVIRFADKHKAAFRSLKHSLCQSVGLHTPCADQPFVIHTDASDFAVGACLSQVVNEEHNPIAFASAKLSDVQQRWSTIEKEAYAIIFALNKFDFIVFGREIHLYTDHNPLQYITACTPKSAKLTRWALSLSRYNVKVFHIKGKDNVVADFLSRTY